MTMTFTIEIKAKAFDLRTLNKVDGAVDYVGASIYDNNGMQTTTGFDVYRNPAIKDKALAFFKTITL